MAFFSQCMLQMAIELASHDPTYESMIVKFGGHFIWIAAAMSHMGKEHESMWDEEDGFFYKVLRLPDGTAKRLKVRSMVGLLPLCASSVFHGAAALPRCRTKTRPVSAKTPQTSRIGSLSSPSKKMGLAELGCVA